MYNSWICFCFFVCEAMLLISLNYARRTLVGINISIYFAQFSFYSLLLSHFLVYYLFRRDLFFFVLFWTYLVNCQLFLLFLVFLVALLFDLMFWNNLREETKKKREVGLSVVFITNNEKKFDLFFKRVNILKFCF